MAATEHALAYLDELYAFRKAVSPDDKDGPKPDDESDEDAALRRLRAWGAVEPEVYFFRTIGHFRHLRNHYAHLNQSLNQPFSRHINHYSHQLQRFWADRGTITLGFDFTRRDVDAIDLDISLAAMNLLRASIREVDTIFASTLRLEHVLRAEFDEAYQDNPTHHRNAEKLASKVRTKLERNYGELFDAHVVTLRVKEILDTR